MKLVIVESPAKAKTINKYLGKDYQVLASFGHIRDLPAQNGSVLPEKDFQMKWATDAKGEKHLKDIICNHWKLFSKYLKKQDSFKNKVDTIYGVRCKVAHNSLSITENEITLSKIYIDEILTIIR